MPTRADHLAQADKNERLAQIIGESGTSFERPTDWEVTMLFYSALHPVDAYLEQSQGVHPVSHRNREWYVSNVTQLRPIVRHCIDLYERSLDAQYRLVSITAAQGSRINRDAYQPIRSHVRRLLNDTGPSLDV